MFRFLAWLVIGAAPMPLMAQQAALSGTVTEDDSPVQGAMVRIPDGGLADTTDAAGRFDFTVPSPGTYALTIELAGYAVYTISVQVSGDTVLEPIVFHSSELGYDAQSLPTASLAESGLIDESGLGVSSVLSASRDAFESAAAFKFSTARFRVRGYDNENFITYMNGAPMTDLESGRTMYFTWSGLNDMVRNRETSTGLSPSGFAYGAAGGSFSIDSRASGQRKQTQASFSLSNRSYDNRIMVSHGTGILENGWSFGLSASRRWANEGYVEGTFYDGWSYFAAAEKNFNTGHSLALTVFGAPTRSGLATASVQEMNDLAGTNYYNPNWGYQAGEKRNARVRKGHQPVAILTHELQVNDRLHLYSALGYVTGRSSVSALDWIDAPDPRPDYYKNLPSYYFSLDQATAGNALTQLLGSDEKARQIDWDLLYERNFLAGDTAAYLVEDRVTKYNIYSLNSTLTYALSGHTTLTTGLTYIRQQSENFLEVNDLLGAKYHLDINKFARQDFPDSPDAYQSDLNHPGRTVTEGDRFGYDYMAHIQRPSGWIQGRFELEQVDFFVATELASVSFYRDGKYRSGLFPDSSLGHSETLNFFDYSLKGGITYKINGRNFLFVNGLTGKRAPTFENSFVSPRTRNQVAPGIESEDITSAEGGYLLKAPKLKIKATAFHTQFKNGIRTVSYFSESNDAYVNYTLTGIHTTHKGIEAGLAADIGYGFGIEAAAAAGEYYYTSRPLAVITQDNLAQVIAYNDTVFIKNLHVAGTPQTAYTLGLNYRSPRFWFVNFSVNYFDRIYIDYFPGRRNREALDLVEAGSGDWDAILSQEKTGGKYTVDVFAGWSWKMNNRFRNMKNNTYLVLQAGVNNLLNNKELITGGYEYSRFGDVQDLAVFRPKYYYAYGTTFYINLALRLN